MSQPTRCESSACIRARAEGDFVTIRSTHLGTKMTATRAEWDAFVEAVQAGEFKLDTLRPWEAKA